MKKTILLTSIIAIAIVSMLSSCVDSEKDLYDPSYQTANPMGDGFAAPDGFDWNMTTTSILNIEIDDELYNQIEILDANPFSTSDYHILAKGVAKKGQAFSQEINYTEGTNYLYIRKTDSRSRVSISTWDVSKNKEFVGSRTTRVAKATIGSYNIPEKYPEETYDTTGAIELTGNTNWNQSNHHLEAGKSYIIKNKFNGEINHTRGYLNGGRFTIFVEGEWTPSQNQIQSADIIILKGGKINTDSFTSFLIADNSILTIQSGGSLIGNNINLAAIGVLLKNFGTISVNSMKDLNTTSILYNAPKATINVTGKSVASWEQSVFTKGAIYNFGELTIQEGALKFNSQDATCYFYNGTEATINTPTFIIGGIGVNDGTVNAQKISNDNGGNPTFTNNCSLYAQNSFEFGGTSGTIIMNKGILAGGVENGTFIAIPSFKCGNSGSTFELNNGSMIKAEIMDIPNVTFKAAGTRSLIKSTKSISTGWTTKFNGNLDIECPEGEFAKGVPANNPNYIMENSVELYIPNGSKTIITSCGELSEIPDPTPDPEDPEFPIEVEDNKDYTYLFEDQWPLYGDYDMNDIVLTIQKRKIYTNKENKVTKFELSIDLSAAGATKSIGAAIMLDNVPANAITQSVEFSDNTLAKNFNLNNNNIESGQDYAVIPLFDDAHKVLGRDRYEQINTVSDYAGNTKPKNISFSITFNNPTISADAFNVNNLNVFIIVDGNRNPRKEIHVAGYQPTKLANTDLFGGNNDNSHHGSKKYYISKENLAWGIMVPSNFKWPLEYVNIKTAYSQFSDWVTSGGTENEKWWNDFDVNKVFQTNKN